MHLSVSRIEPKCILVLSHGVVEPTLPMQYASEVIVNGGQVGPELQGFAQMRRCFLRPPHLKQEVAQIVVSFNKTRLQL